MNLQIGLAKTYLSIGSIHQINGNFQKALNFYQKTKVIFENTELKLDLANYFDVIGGFYSDQNKYPEALSNYFEAIKIKEELELPLHSALSYNGIGNVYEQQGKYTEALVWYNKALNIYEEVGQINEAAKTIRYIAQVFSEQDLFDRALEYNKKALEYFKMKGNDPWLAEMYNVIGTTYFSQGDLEEALVWEKKALEVRQKLGIETGLAISYLNLGEIYTGLGDYNKSLDYLKNALQICDSLDLKDMIASIYSNLGIVFDELGQYNLATGYFGKAIEVQTKLGLDARLLTTYDNLIYSYFVNQFQPDSVFHYSTKFLALNKKLRNLNLGRSDRRLFARRSLGALEAGIISAQQIGKHIESFELSEQNKSNELIELLFEGEKIVSNNSFNENNDYQTLKILLGKLQKKLSGRITEEYREQLIFERDSIYLKLIELEDLNRVTEAEYTNLVYPEAIDAEQVQIILQKNEVLVSYFSGFLRSYAFLLSPNDLQVIDLGPSDSLKIIVEQFRNDFIPQQKAIVTSPVPNRLLQAKLNQQFYNLSSQLYQNLWAPLDSTGLLKDKKIILVPDGFLNYLPFELLVKDTVKKDFQDYQYLIQNHPISYYPSATVLHFERTKERKKTKPQKDYFGLAVSNFENALCTEDGIALNNLDNTTSSVTSIQTFFHPDKSTTLFNEAANKDYFSSLDLKDYRYLDFITHGQINSEKPEFSNILLYDACLNLYEIFDLKFNADLVTLSACETGLGKLVQGEGMVGFTRALMYAGTPSVILSLWEVGDDSTKEFVCELLLQAVKRWE